MDTYKFENMEKKRYVERESNKDINKDMDTRSLENKYNKSTQKCTKTFTDRPS